MHPDPAELGPLLQGDELPVVHKGTKGHWLQPQHRSKIPFSGQEVVASTEGTSGSLGQPLLLWDSPGDYVEPQAGLCHLPEGPWVACTNSEEEEKKRHSQKS